MATKKKKKPANRGVEITLFGVILSYPDLHDPKPFKGKVYYRTDILFEKGHPQLTALKEAIHDVKVAAWGDDESEWPEEDKTFIHNGNEREDQASYKNRRFITASTQTPVPVVDLKNKTFDPRQVRGGMWANVAINIRAWEFDGDMGVSIYLQGVQVDTSKPKLDGFGGGRSVDQMFKKSRADDEDEEDGDEDTDGNDSDSDDEDDAPARKRKPAKKSRRDEDDDADDEEDDKSEDEDASDDEEEETPRKKKSATKSKRSRDFDDDED